MFRWLCVCILVLGLGSRAFVPPGFMPSPESKTNEVLTKVVVCHHVNPLARSLKLSETPLEKAGQLPPDQSAPTSSKVPPTSPFCFLQSMSWAITLVLVLVLVGAFGPLICFCPSPLVIFQFYSAAPLWFTFPSRAPPSYCKF
jgi:hypothetical protein